MGQSGRSFGPYRSWRGGLFELVLKDWRRRSGNFNGPVDNDLIPDCVLVVLVVRVNVVRGLVHNIGCASVQIVDVSFDCCAVDQSVVNDSVVNDGVFLSELDRTGGLSR